MCLRPRAGEPDKGREQSCFRESKEFAVNVMEENDGQKRVGQIKEQFDLVIHSDETAKIEFWYARDLMSLLGYERWENFDKAIGRAMESCKTSGIEVSDHFVRSRK